MKESFLFSDLRSYTLQIKENFNFQVINNNDFYITALVLLNNKHVLDFTGNTDEPLDLGKESFRIFIKAVELKCSSYQNTISEKY